MMDDSLTVMVGLVVGAVMLHGLELGLPSCVCEYFAACAAMSLIMSLIQDSLS